MARTRKQRNIRQKISAVNLIHEIGVKAAAQQLGMPISSLRQWRKDEAKLVKLANIQGFNPQLRVCKPVAD
jgi:hypothetical protein